MHVYRERVLCTYGIHVSDVCMSIYIWGMILRKAVFTNVVLPLLGEAIQHVHRIGYEELEECTIPCSLELPWTISEIPFTMFAAQEMADMGAGQVHPIFLFTQIHTYIHTSSLGYTYIHLFF